MIEDLVEWMDDHFGHDLTNIIINVTVIGRGVDAVFLHPSLQPYSGLKGPIKLLLQIGFSREYRDATWGEILQYRAYGFLVDQFAAIPRQYLTEVRAAINAAIRTIFELLDQEEEDQAW